MVPRPQSRHHDGWDAEIWSKLEWTECAGFADKGAHDLRAHSNKTGHPLRVNEQFATPRLGKTWNIKMDNKAFASAFKRRRHAVKFGLMATTQEERERMAKQMQETGKTTLEVEKDDVGRVEIRQGIVEIKHATTASFQRQYTPNVVESSFGMGRILYALCEHSVRSRPRKAECQVLSFPPSVAPTKVAVVLLAAAAKPLLESIVQTLDAAYIAHRVDSTPKSVAKAYARSDESGVPFLITLDAQSAADGTASLRERDTAQTVRGDVHGMLEAVRRMLGGEEAWPDVTERLVREAAGPD